MRPSSLCTSLALAAALLGFAATAAGQVTPLHTKVTVSFHDQEMGEVLKDLSNRSGVRFVCDEELLRGADRVTYATAGQEVGRVAGRILRPRGLKLGRLEAGRVAVERLDALEEIKTKRAERFEFTERPTAVRDGDTMSIRFAVTDYCDATVAIEDAGGQILRHLASGVLGENAPEPFLWNTKRQELVWDCKDDKGEYVRDRNLVVRVSLGLQARFERTLYWSPYKLGQNGEQPSFFAAQEGVYVYSPGVGRASLTPWLKLFDHDGRYVRTLYPFPAGEVEQVQGVPWQSYPPDQRKFPVKNPPEAQTSLLPWPLTSNDILRVNDVRMSLIVDKDYVYLVGTRVLRIAKSGSGKASILQGPELSIIPEQTGRKGLRHNPASVAMSPDGKWLYLTSYSAFYGKQDEGHGWLHFLPCVMRIPTDCSKAPEPFVGAPIRPEAGCPLANPGGVACDREGRVYVTDFTEGLLIFSPEGKLLHQMQFDSAARVQVAADTGEIWVTGWPLAGAYGGPQTGQTRQTKENVVLYRLSPFTPGSDLKIEESFVVGPDVRANRTHDFALMVDLAGKTRRVWFANALGGWGLWGSGPLWQTMNVKILEFRDRKLQEFASFETLAKRDVMQSRPPRYARQRPYVNPADGCVYIAEQIQPTVVSDVQCFDQLVKIDPHTGRCSMVDLPFDTEDMAFDPDGLAYLRTESILARYDPKTWGEVPFDYGMELSPVTHYGLKPAQVLSAPYFRGGRGASGKIFGMGINARGDVAVSFYSTDVSSVEMAGDGNPDVKRPEINVQVKGVKPWVPRVFPGRSTYAFIHVWDRHGKLKFEDAVPGLGEMSDFKIDNDCNLYMISNMVLPGYLRVHPDKFVNTLVKMVAGKGRILTDGKVPVPLAEEGKPKRPPDAIGLSGYRGNVWLEGAAWMLGGLGANARDLSARACHCEANSGMALDYYGRSFVPAIHRYEVAVVDTAGNVVLRIGRYGNVEDGVPLVKAPGPENPRPIGGDEVSLVSPKWLAVHTDRRLFVSDRGNYRVVSVKLDYHAEEKVSPSAPQ